MGLSPGRLSLCGRACGVEKGGVGALLKGWRRASSPSFFPHLCTSSDPKAPLTPVGCICAVLLWHFAGEGVGARNAPNYREEKGNATGRRRERYGNLICFQPLLPPVAKDSTDGSLKDRTGPRESGR